MKICNQFDIAKSMFAPKSADSSVKLPAPCELATREKLLALMDSSYLTNTLSAIRTHMAKIMPETPEAERREVKEQVNALKRKLPIVIPLAHFTNGHRMVEEPVNYTLSPWSMIDVDNVDNPDELWQSLVKPRIEELRIVWVFNTPSTRGIKIMYLRPDGMDEAESQKWMAGKLGLNTYDVSCKNVARIHYLVSRDYCYLLDLDKMFDTDLTNKGYRPDSTEASTEPVSSTSAAVSEESQSGPIAKASAEPAASTTMEAPTEPAPSVEVDGPEPSLEYQGVPYSEYVDVYWQLHNGGSLPTKGDRDTLTFELAMAMRHITGFDVNLLDRIIPCYDGFSEAEKRKCIESAVSYKRGPMPRKMQEVINTIKRRHADRPDVVQALDDLEEQDMSFYFESLETCFASRGKKFPMGISDSFDGVQPSLRMVMLIGIGPMIGALATGVSLLVHDEPSKLNLIAYIVGEAASGKSKVDQLYRLWLYRIIKADDVNTKIMADWKALPKKKREEKPRPVVQIRNQPLRTSMADVLDHFNNADGKHLYSFTPEADQLSQNNRSGAFANVSVLIRQAYDGSEYRSSYAGENAVNANVAHVLWNMTLCTTPDGMRRAMPNVVNGELTRIAIASTPDNTFAPLVRIKPRSEEAKAAIMQVAGLLELMEGELNLPLLEEQSNRWLESVRLSTLMNGDDVKARQRFRVAVTAMRYVCCMMLCAYAEWLIARLDKRGKRALPKWAHGAETAEQYLRSHPTAVSEQVPKLFQTDEYLQAYNVIADYMVDGILYYFRPKLTAAYKSDDYMVGERKRAGSNDSVYERLPQEFTLEQARQAKGLNESDNAANQMVKNWCKQGLAIRIGNCLYRKLM